MAFRRVYLAVGLVVSSLGMSGQNEIIGPTTLLAAPVLGVPLSASFIQERRGLTPPGEAPVFEASGRIFRDGRGRERRESTVKLGSGGELTFVIITDFEAGQLITLDRDTSTAIILPLSPRPTEQAGPQSSTQTRPSTQGTPTYEMIESVRCRVMDATIDQPSGAIRIKAWISDDLGQVLREESAAGEFTSLWRLSDIRLFEQDASLFRIPDGYLVVNRTTRQ
jgi:hypothetical protein